MHTGIHTGKSLKVALINKDMNQSLLAERMGVSRQVVGRLCNTDSMSLKSLNLICNILDYRIDEFLQLGVVDKAIHAREVKK